MLLADNGDEALQQRLSSGSFASTTEGSISHHAKRKRKANGLPMLASACPGWICYAEKTHGEYVLPYISTTKSPQVCRNFLQNTQRLKCAVEVDCIDFAAHKNQPQ